MKLIDNWRKAHRLSSMQIMAVAATLEVANNALDGVVPPWVSLLLILSAMVARLVAQESAQ